MQVSVVVPAHNEERALPNCLEGLARQRTQHTYEVIVVDNASNDRTAEIVRAWQNRLKLQLISEPRKGRGSARRRGFAEAKTEIILSTDADSVVPPDWIEALVDELLAHPSAAAVSGSSYITDGTRITNWTMLSACRLVCVCIGCSSVIIC